MSSSSSYQRMTAKVIRYLERKPLLGLINLDDLYRSVAIEKEDRQQAYNFLSRSSIGTRAAVENPRDHFYAIYLPLIGNPQKKVYLSLNPIPEKIIKMENPNSDEVKILKNQLREKYGTTMVDFWLQAAQNYTIRIADNAMREAKKRDRGACVLCELEKNFNKKENLDAGRRGSNKKYCSHIISRNTIFWSEVKRIDLEYPLFSLEGSTALYTALMNNQFLNNPANIAMLCHKHDRLLIHTIKQFSEEIQ